LFKGGIIQWIRDAKTNYPHAINVTG